MEADSRPNVRSYLDANQFLQDMYKYLKHHSTKKEKFSYELWAQEMGVKSKSYLRFAILGQRGISAELAQKISDSLKFEGLDREYFTVLVVYTQTRQKEQKNLLGRRLTQLLRSESNMKEIAPPTSLISNPLTMAVRNLLSFSDIPRTSEFLQKLLNCSEESILEILNKLSEEQLVIKKGNEWEALSADVKISNQTRAETLFYHKQCLLKAIEAQTLPLEERNYRSIGLALSAEQYQSYLEHLDQFVKNVFSLFNEDTISNKRLYQINFNLFPWTKELQ